MSGLSCGAISLEALTRVFNLLKFDHTPKKKKKAG